MKQQHPSVVGNAAPKRHRLLNKKCQVQKTSLWVVIQRDPVVSKTTQGIDISLNWRPKLNINSLLLKTPHNFGYRTQINQVGTELEMPFLLACFQTTGGEKTSTVSSSCRPWWLQYWLTRRDMPPGALSGITILGLTNQFVTAFVACCRRGESTSGTINLVKKKTLRLRRSRAQAEFILPLFL